MMKHLIFIIILLPSIALADHTLATTALLVEEPDDTALALKLEPLIAHSDSRIRATAARVANVRSLTTLLPALRTALTNEKIPEAAREQVRAIALLGEREEIDFLAGEIKRFDGRLDGTFASAIARRGMVDAMELYDSHAAHLASLGDAGNFFQIAFWGAPKNITPTAARLLGRKDERGWLEFLRALSASNLLPPIGVAVAALNAEDDRFRLPLSWHLARTLACEGELPGCRTDFTKFERDLLLSNLQEPDDPASPVAFRFGRELLRRILAIETDPKPKHEFISWLGSQDADRYISPIGILAKYLTRAERTALAKGEKLPNIRQAKGRLAPTALRPADIGLPSPLPSGSAAAILTETKCSAPWIGVASVALEKYGRVASIDLTNLQTTNECRRAVAALMRLSLPTNRSITSSHSAIPEILLVRDGKSTMCLEEPEVLPVSAQRLTGMYTVGHAYEGNVKPPKVKRRVDPVFPEGARKSVSQGGGSAMVIAEAVITQEGCVRDVRLVAQSPLGELNRSALFAVSQWTFEPGTLNGKPVDVVFNLTINFRTN